MTSDPTTRVDREDRMLLKIEEFRKRRPRLIDEHVTLAHGAGGKSSAALVDAVFVEAFRNPELEQLGDGAVLTLPSRGAAGVLHRLVRGAAPASSPAGRSATWRCTARSTTSRSAGPSRSGSPRRS